MSRATLFWVIMLLLLVFGVVVYWPIAQTGSHYWVLGYPVVNWLLLALLGWQVYGPAIKG